MAAKPTPAPGPSFIEKPFIRQDPEGTRLMFECRIASTTEPEVTWFQNDLKVKNGGRYTIKKVLDGAGYLATLEISDPNRKDAGKFDVKVKNAAGDCKSTVFSFMEA
ncbi:hypothetical protein BV898_09110 [Hypsibius exemplaris]|uniref:Ig-like domain-containing protein n=1 Tax=Hypsibius exemplaris TaxID=2072580 RepID=A0A1W0WNK7_HYPEX|nr:hypothetical protein BV898_09110 [Hypsibius exemplaris]